MSSVPVRIEAATVRALRKRSSESGEPMARLAQRYIEEGLRIERHPAIFFRTGPAGRRAVVVGGADVWEIITAVRGASEKGDALFDAIAERTGARAEHVRSAVRYYSEYPDEIDQWMAMVEEEAEQLEKVFERERQLLE